MSIKNAFKVALGDNTVRVLASKDGHCFGNKSHFKSVFRYPNFLYVVVTATDTCQSQARHACGYTRRTGWQVNYNQGFW